MKRRRATLWLVLLVAHAGGVQQAVVREAAGQQGVGQQTEPGQSGSKQENVLREQTIYIPYDKLQKSFEKEGRGVFLPYEKFQELWRASRASEKSQEPPPRPVDAIIHSIESEATIGDQVVNVVSTLQLEILGEGWVTIPLRLSHSAIRKATLDGEPARVVFDNSKGHQLLFEKSEGAPVQTELKLEYTRAFEKTPGQSSVVFEAPQASINKWTIRVPTAGMAVEISPMIAATRQGDGENSEEDNETALLAFVGAASQVRIAWNPKAEGASGLAAFATVQSEHQITISEGVARTAIKLDFDISRAELTELVVEVPLDQKVVNVFDRNVQRWNVTAEEDQQVIRVELFEPTRGKQSLLVELEQFNDASQQGYDVSAALLRVRGVSRQQGIIVTRLEEGLQGEAIQRTGLLQLDQNDLPESLRITSWGFAYRYGAIPYHLTVRVEKVLPRISVTELIEAELDTNRMTLNWQGVYQIEDAGLFQLRVDVPDDFEVRSIQGKGIGDAAAVAVDAYHRDSEGSTTWIVNLSKRAMGKVALTMQLQRPLNDPNLLSPTGETSAIEVPLPRAHGEDVEFAQGALVLLTPQSLRINPTEVDGLRSVSFSEAYQAVPAAPRSSSQLQPVLSYAFAKGPTQLAVTAERRRPQVAVDQLLQAEIEAGVVKFQATFYYDVKYSGVKSFRIDVPTALTQNIRVTNKSLRREAILPPPDDVPEDYTAWAIAAESELLGASKVDLQWEEKIAELGIGKSHVLSIPRLIPAEVDLANGQIVIGKSESMDVQPTTTSRGLVPIDPHNDLRHRSTIDTAAMAFTFLDDWALDVRATRYELESSKLTSVDRSLIRIVALSQGELSVQALYRMSSARQRLSIQLPEDAVFDAQPLRIDGKPVTAERESATTISAPLLEQDIDKKFVLELRYTTKGTPDQLEIPWLPDNPAVQQVTLGVYLPDKVAPLASDGPWSNERGGDGPPWLPASRPQNERQLVEWVTGSNKAAFNSATTFAIGSSHRFTYSTLRPPEPPEGSLHLKTASRKLLNAVIVLAVALLGLPLFRRSLRSQLALLLLLTAAMLLIGVFLPELARSVLESIFPVAIILLLILWLIGHITRLKWLRSSAARTPESPNPILSRIAAVNQPSAGSQPLEGVSEQSEQSPFGREVEQPSPDEPQTEESPDDETDGDGGRHND